MRRRLPIAIRILLLALLPLAQASAQEQDDKPKTLAEAKALALREAAEEGKNLPGIEAAKLQDVVRVSLEKDNLVVRTMLSTTETAVVHVPGLQGFVKLGVLQVQGKPPAMPSRLEFEYRDFSPPDAVALITSVSYLPGHLDLTQAKDLFDDELERVQLIQSQQNADNGGSRVAMYVQVTNVVPPIDQHFYADNMAQLRREHPAETARYVDPILRALEQESVFSQVDPKLAWQIFADVFRPPAEQVEKVKAILARLNAEEFQAREAASEELQQLGQPAALVLMGMDRKTFSDEQIARVDAFVSPYKPVSDEAAERLRNDPDFLVDCLAGVEEQALRARALEQLRKVLRKSIEFDITAPAPTRLAAASKLRATFPRPATTQPSTNPSQP